MTSQTKQRVDDMSTPKEDKKYQEWNQEQLVKIQKFCFTKGVQIKGFQQKRCMALPPILGIFYVNSTEKGDDYWLISGEVPTDIAPAKVAKDARDLLRYFSMSWHLKAARIEEAIAEGKQLGDKETQEKVVKELIQKAEGLSQLHQDESLWKNTGLTIS